MEVTAITRRRHPILTSFISQVTPSESSVIRRVAMEPVYLHHLRSVLGIRGVMRVAMHEPLTSLYAVIGIQFARGTPETEIWRALHGAARCTASPASGSSPIDEDIDPDNADALFWAMSYRCQPQHDLKVVPHKDPGHGPRGPRDGGETAAVLINATFKGAYAPVALPRREFMEQREGDLGAARAAAANAAAAVARLRSRPLAGGAGAPGRDGGPQRLFRARPQPRQ